MQANSEGRDTKGASQSWRAVVPTKLNNGLVQGLGVRDVRGVQRAAAGGDFVAAVLDGAQERGNGGVFRGDHDLGSSITCKRGSSQHQERVGVKTTLPACGGRVRPRAARAPQPRTRSSAQSGSR